MAIELNLEGIKLQFAVYGWKPTIENAWDDNWCNVKLGVYNSFMNYQIDSDVLLSCEVEEIASCIGKSLAGEEVKHLEFIEPDLELEFVRPHTEEEEATAKLIINFWDEGVLTTNSLHLTLCEEDLKSISEYLEKVIREGVLNG